MLDLSKNSLDGDSRCAGCVEYAVAWLRSADMLSGERCWARKEDVLTGRLKRRLCHMRGLRRSCSHACAWAVFASVNGSGISNLPLREVSCSLFKRPPLNSCFSRIQICFHHPFGINTSSIRDITVVYGWVRSNVWFPFENVLASHEFIKNPNKLRRHNACFIRDERFTSSIDIEQPQMERSVMMRLLIVFKWMLKPHH
jgi:hypothetical protein